jgi:hypothetical protein
MLTLCIIPNLDKKMNSKDIILSALFTIGIDFVLLIASCNI